MFSRVVGLRERKEESEVVWTESHASASFSLYDWITVNVTFINSTTTTTPYNISFRSRVEDGEWRYKEMSYWLAVSADDVELNCDFVADVLGIMEKVVLGYDTASEVDGIHKKYGREICIDAIVGASGTFTHHSTYNSTFSNITLTTEPGRIVRSLPSLLGFSVHCAVNQALRVNGLITIILTSTQWLVTWLLGDQFPSPLPTAIFVMSGLWIWAFCAAAEAIASGVTSAVRERSLWPRLGLRCRHLLLTLLLPFIVGALANVAVEVQRVQHDPVVHQSVEDFHANATRVEVGEFTIMTWDEFYARSDRERRQWKARRIANTNAVQPSSERRSRLPKLSEREAAVVRAWPDSITGPSRVMQPFRWAHKPTDRKDYMAVIQGYGILECTHSVPIYELVTPDRFPGVSRRTVDKTKHRLRMLGDHCQKPSFLSACFASRPGSARKITGFNGRCAQQLP